VSVVDGTCLVASAADAVPASLVGRSDAVVAAVDQLLAAKIGVGVGDEVEVIAPRYRLTPMGMLPVRLRLEVAQIVPAEPGSESGSIRMPLADAQRLLWGEPAVAAIELRDPSDPWHLASRVRRALGDRAADLRIEGLDELHRPLRVALALERVMIFVAVGLMLVVAALNLLSNVAMVAAEKRTDLAVLSGLGLPPSSLRRLFVLIGMGIGSAGAVLGAVLGVVVAITLDKTEALPLPRGVFLASAVPFRVDPRAVILVVAVALVLSAAVSWLPSRAVARREPAEGLRYE
jgi:lipoprotein-releasing system permease protein